MIQHQRHRLLRGQRRAGSPRSAHGEHRGPSVRAAHAAPYGGASARSAGTSSGCSVICQRTVGCARPLDFGPVAIQLDAIAVGIVQVRAPRSRHGPMHHRGGCPRGPAAAARRRAMPGRDTGSRHDRARCGGAAGVIRRRSPRCSARGDGGSPPALMNAAWLPMRCWISKPSTAVPERQRPLEVGNLEVHVPDVHPRVDRRHRSSPAAPARTPPLPRRHRRPASGPRCAALDAPVK